MLNAYPIFFVLAGFAASAVLYRRAVALMPAGSKAALIDASSRTNLLSLIVLALFIVLLLWRPLLGWAFLGCAYLGLGVRSVFRLRRIDVPARAARLVLAGNWAAVGGIALCAFVFVHRALR